MLNKILIITMEYPPVSLGGAATVVQYHAEGLARLGLDTHVVFDDHIPRINQPGVAKQISREQPQQQTGDDSMANLTVLHINQP